MQYRKFLFLNGQINYRNLRYKNNKTDIVFSRLIALKIYCVGTKTMKYVNKDGKLDIPF